MAHIPQAPSGGSAIGARQRHENALVLSYLALRRAIGTLGFFLPVVLFGWSMTLGGGLRPSISDYYYTPMREVFVGTMCAIAVFLWSYEGYRPRPAEWPSDRLMSRIASLGALGTALIPTAREGLSAGPSCTLSLAQCLFTVDLAGALHFLAAGTFLGALAIISLVLFTRGDLSDEEKRASNAIYRGCGWVIVACLAAIALLKLSDAEDGLVRLAPVFWLEVLATLAFSVSWMVKGDWLRPMVRAVAAAEH